MSGRIHGSHKKEKSSAGIDPQASVIPDVDTLEENWHELVDIFDSLLENADACLNEYTGVARKRSRSQEQLYKPLLYLMSIPLKRIGTDLLIYSTILSKRQMLAWMNTQES